MPQAGKDSSADASRGHMAPQLVKRIVQRLDYDIGPGQAFEFKVTAKPGERLTIATMFAQSNDLFYAPREDGIALFDASGKPIRGDVTSQILLWDAGTDVNHEHSLSPDDGERQRRATT